MMMLNQFLIKVKVKVKVKVIPPPPPPPPINSKYDKMIKMGIPKDAVLQKMRLENNPKKLIQQDLQNVTLKKTVIIKKKRYTLFSRIIKCYI